MSETTPKPPKHLRAATRKWFERVVQSYELEEHHVRLLASACEAWDRAQEARELLAKHGLTFTDRHGAPRARPECNIERDNRVLFARLLRELALDIAAPADDVRPPRLSITGRTTKGVANA